MFNIFSFSKALCFGFILSLFLAAICFGQVPGELDQTFYAGRTTTKFGVSWNVFKTTAIQSDGKIVAAGYHYTATRPNIAVARYNPDGTLDKSFSGDGKLSLALGDTQADASAVAIQPDGKIILAGFTTVGNKRDFMVARLNPDGSFDNTFSGDGIASTPVTNSNSEIYSMVLQHDGKIVVAGKTGILPDCDFAIARFNTNGTLDFTFGNGGIVTMPFGTGGDYITSIALQNNKLIVGGYTVNASFKKEIAIARFNMNGSLDNTFSQDGKVTLAYLNTDAVAFQAAAQNDGKLVIAGSVRLAGKDNFLLARYNADGTLDNTFEADGIVIASLGASDDVARAVSVQWNGKISVAGYTTTPNSEKHFAAARYNTDGSLDATFDVDGKSSFPIGGVAYSYAMSLQADGKMVLVGASHNPAYQDAVVARLNTDGGLDRTFGNRVFTNFGEDDDRANAVATQSDGKILAAGWSNNGTNKDFAIARYNADGTPDFTFGNKGMVTTAIGSGNDEARAIAVLSNGKIIVAGYSVLNNLNHFAVVRYNANGTLDATFDGDGKAVTAVGVSQSLANAMAIQADGKIVLAGIAIESSNYDFAVVRYNQDGALDGSFDTDGKLITPISGFSDTARAVVIQADGKIVVAGDGYNGGTNRDFTLVRYNADGALDITFNNSGKSFVEMGSQNDIPYALALQADGKIVAAGQGTFPDLNFAVARYTTDGFLDTDFDIDGRVITDFIAGNADSARALVIQADGKIVVGGITTQAAITSAAFIRYNPDGAPDIEFDSSIANPNGDGKTVIPIGESSDFMTNIAIQNDGRIIAVGYGQNGTDDDFQVIRLNGTQPALKSALIPVGGRVMTADGTGIRNVTVSITLPGGETRTTLSGASGHYRFEEIPVGETYILKVSAKRFNFSEPMRTKQIFEDANNIDFIANNN
ncbi:MAG TPA: carboxypeptidase regulatory-like domain-containing protein [Pyrinomonadaceae bacterium]